MANVKGGGIRDPFTILTLSVCGVTLLLIDALPRRDGRDEKGFSEVEEEAKQRRTWRKMLSVNLDL